MQRCFNQLFIHSLSGEHFKLNCIDVLYNVHADEVDLNEGKLISIKFHTFVTISIFKSMKSIQFVFCFFFHFVCNEKTNAGFRVQNYYVLLLHTHYHKDDWWVWKTTNLLILSHGDMFSARSVMLLYLSASIYSF